MAKVNNVLLHGQLKDKPRVYVNADGSPGKVMFAIRVLRRPYISPLDKETGRLFFDCPVIMSRNPEFVKKCGVYQKGTMITVKGAISTKEVKKVKICPICKEQITVQGNITYITPIYIEEMEQVDEAEGTQLLKKRAEISNVVEVIGNLCKEPEMYESDKSKIAQFQLAVGRRFHVREDSDDIKTDYPWVKVFGTGKAEEVMHDLHKSSTVLLNGSVQTREITRLFTCPHCGGEFKAGDVVSEIVPYYIDYLANCTPLKKEGDETDGEEEISTE